MEQEEKSERVPRINYGKSRQHRRQRVQSIPILPGQVQPRFEVFLVSITNIHGSGPFYGTITVRDGLRLQFLYNRTREESHYFAQGDTLLLTGPHYSISALGTVTIDIDLVDNDDVLSPNNGFKRDRISWNCFNPKYDLPFYREVVGKYCSLKVNYIVFRDALPATVEVTLIIGKDTANVYGQISACNDNFLNAIVLFQKASNEHIDVRPGQLIPLSRSVVAMPFNSVLKIRADLWDYDASDVIFEGIAKFHTSPSGTFEEGIRGHGQGHEIQVKVTWNAPTY